MPSAKTWLVTLLLGSFHLFAPGESRILPAPPSAFSFKDYGVGQGLTNLSVTAMTQDSKGFPWVGTEDGLFRLEGGRFRRFGREEGLLDVGIAAGGLSANETGGLWIMTARGLRFYWDGQGFRGLENLGLEGFEDQYPVMLPRGGVIYRKADYRRFLFLSPTVSRELVGLPLVGGLRGGWLSQDGKDLMVIIGSTLWIQQGNVWTSRDLSRHLKGQSLALLKDRRGRIWVRTLRQVFRMDSLEAPIEDLSGRAALGGLDTCYLAEDPLGRVWTNTPGSLVWHEDQNFGYLGEGEGLPQGGANVLMVDREGSLWTGGDGIHRLLGRFLWTGYTRRQGLPAHIVWGLARSRDGLLWAGTSGGLAFGDAQGWHPIPGTGQRQFSAFAEDPQGNLWCASGGDETEYPRLYLHRNGTRGVEELKPLGFEIGDSIFALAWDPRGFLWAGTEDELYRLDKDGGTWKARKEVIPEWPEGSGGVQCLSVGVEGSFWVAAGEGLAHWDGSRWWTLAKPPGIDDPLLISVAAIGNQGAWISYGNQKLLSRVGWKEGRLQALESYGHPHPLAAHLITSLKLDAHGSLWMGTSLGIKRWDGQNLERFGRDWGLPGEDCAQNALWIDPNGDVWVGLSVGVGHYQDLGAVQPLNNVRSEITSIQDGGGQSHAPSRVPIRIPWRRHTLTFLVTSQSFVGEGSLQRQVRLVGLEDEWRVIEDREARYPGLAAGSYRFEVRSGREDGSWGPVKAQAFEVLAPWWQSWWFRLMGLAALGGAIAQLFQVRSRVLKQRITRLNRLVEARTRDLQDTQERLTEMTEKSAMAWSDLPGWTDQIALELTQSLGVHSVEVWIREKDASKPLTSTLAVNAPEEVMWSRAEKGPFQTPEGHWVVPARGLGTGLRALLLVRGEGVALKDTDHRLLATFAHHLGAAIELNAARKNLALAEEARRIRKEDYLLKGIPLLHACPECGSCFDQDFLVCPEDGAELDSSRLFPLVIANRYRLTRILGRGAMGMVYRATDLRLERPVALKVIHPDHIHDQEIHSRFALEAQILARLNHPGVISIFDSGELDDGTAYLVMELLVGVSLSQALEQFGPPSVHQAAAIVEQVGSALGAAHEAGLVHRDIKPDNIFILGSGPNLAIKLLDFGLARHTESATHLTQAGMVMGTPLYMSPEQFGNVPLDRRSDLYSLASVVFELLTGTRLIRGASLGEILLEINQDKVIELGKIRPCLDPNLEGLLARGLHRDRELRPTDVTAWCDALAAALLASPGDHLCWPETIQPQTSAQHQEFATRSLSLPEFEAGS